MKKLGVWSSDNIMDEMKVKFILCIRKTSLPQAHETGEKKNRGKKEQVVMSLSKSKKKISEGKERYV